MAHKLAQKGNSVLARMSLSTGTSTFADRRLKMQQQAITQHLTRDAGQQYLDHYKLHLATSGLNKNTIRSYIFDIQQFLKWCEESTVDPMNLTTQLANEYVRYLEETSHQLRPHLIGRYSYSTIARKLHVTFRFCDFLIDENLVARNPFKDISPPFLESRPVISNIEICSVETIRKLIATCDKTKPKGVRDRAIFFCIAGAGLQVGEVRKLNITDLDLKEGFLKISGRNNKSRTVPLIGDFATSLRAWVVVRVLHVNKCEALFISLHHSRSRGEPGRRLSKRGIRSIVDLGLEMIESKKEGVSCNLLRRSAIVHSLANGADLIDIRSLFGVSPKSLRAIEEYLIDIG